MKKQSGFTLIELLLVLAIIGIISAIAIPALLGQRARARDKAAMANTDSIITDLIAQYDLQKDAGTAITGATLSAALPQFVTARNPWSPATAAYGAVGAAVPPAIGIMGLTTLGYLPTAGAVSGAIGSAVLLNAPVSGSTTFVKQAGID